MLWWVVASVAGAQEWVRVSDEVSAPDWLTGPGTRWVANGDTCLPADVEDAAHGWLAVSVCGPPPDGTDGLRCGVNLTVGDTLEVEGEFCEMTRDGRVDAAITGGRTKTTVIVWDSAVASVPEKPPLVLTYQDEARAQWSPAVALTASPRLVVPEARPCTAASFSAMQRKARRAVGENAAAQDRWLRDLQIVDGLQQCPIIDGVVLQPASAVVPPEVHTTGQPVNCRASCPPLVLPADLEAKASAVAEGRYTPAPITGPQVFATKGACTSAASRPAWIPTDICVRLGVKLRPGG